MSLPSSFSPAATVLDNVQRIFFVVPGFSAVLVILALTKGLQQPTRHAYTVYAYIASLAALSALAGALGSFAKAEAVVQNLLSLFCGYLVRDSNSPHQKDIYDFVLTLILKLYLYIQVAIPVLNLPATHSQHHERRLCQFELIIRIVHTSLLAISLSSG